MSTKVPRTRSVMPEMIVSDGLTRSTHSNPRACEITTSALLLCVTDVPVQSIRPVTGLGGEMDTWTTTTNAEVAVFGCSLLALALAATTNAVVALIDSAAWAWWSSGVCLLTGVLLGGAWSGLIGERAVRRERARAHQVDLVVGEVQPAALEGQHS